MLLMNFNFFSVIGSSNFPQSHEGTAIFVQCLPLPQNKRKKEEKETKNGEEKINEILN